MFVGFSLQNCTVPFFGLESYLQIDLPNGFAYVRGKQKIIRRRRRGRRRRRRQMIRRRKKGRIKIIRTNNNNNKKKKKT